MPFYLLASANLCYFSFYRISFQSIFWIFTERQRHCCRSTDWLRQISAVSGATGFLSSQGGQYKDNINNYWMRLSMISWIIKTEVCVICRSRRLRQITQTRGFDNSWYHAKTEFNNCFITHFAHTSVQPYIQVFSHFVSEENTPRGLVTRQKLNLTW